MNVECDRALDVGGVLPEATRGQISAMLEAAWRASGRDAVKCIIEYLASVGVSKSDYDAVKGGAAASPEVYAALTALSVQGLPEEVLAQIAAAPQAAPTSEPESQPEEPPPIESIDDFGPIEHEAPPAAPTAAAAEKGTDDIENRYFTVRGHDRTQIFVYQYESKMVMSHGVSRWSDDDLTAFAPLHWWELNFPGEKGLNKKLAVNWLQRMAYKRGYFDPNSLRGRGAWRDNGRFVFHFGHKLWVNGQMMDVTEIDSAFIYEQGRRMQLPADETLSNADGKRVFEVFEGFRWARPASAILLAGWCALAPVAGALRWRPHVWITGGAGSGKTTILNFTDWLLNGTNVYANGNSTEAGIRQELRTDSRPVLFDESEQNNEREALRMQNVLSLIRQSSTESNAQTLKGTVGGDSMRFVIRSMFCLSSIQVGLKQQADMERISILSLKPKREGDGAKSTESWDRLSAEIAALNADAELPARLLRRSLILLPTTIENIGVFAQAATEKFGSQRDGDQYGALFAGAWSLVSTKLATLDEARAMIARYDWSEYLEGSETEESDKALSALMSRLVRLEGGREMNIAELAADAAGGHGTLANLTLQRHGLKVDCCKATGGKQALLVAYKHGELDRLMQGTPYAADLKGQLLRIPGTSKTPGSVRFAGVLERGVIIPIEMVVKADDDV